VSKEDVLQQYKRIQVGKLLGMHIVCHPRVACSKLISRASRAPCMHARIKTNTKLASMIVSTQQSAAYKDHVCVVVTGVLVYRGRAVPSIRATKMEGAPVYSLSFRILRFTFCRNIHFAMHLDLQVNSITTSRSYTYIVVDYDFFLGFSLNYIQMQSYH
jgi:hypothetical protein